MTTDPNRARTDEIAALQREVAELRRAVLHLQRTAARHDRCYDELRQNLLKTTAR
jgi:hypothetical protein